MCGGGVHVVFVRYAPSQQHHTHYILYISVNVLVFFGRHRPVFRRRRGRREFSTSHVVVVVVCARDHSSTHTATLGVLLFVCCARCTKTYNVALESVCMCV